MVDRTNHWEQVYGTKSATEVSWYQRDLATSMALIRSVCPPPAGVIDVGGGASFLVDRLLDAGYGPVAVLDIADSALRQARARLGGRAHQVRWITADITAADDLGQFDLWHDRAVFHFLTDPADRKRYVDLATRTVRPGGRLVIGTFALDGPPRCSGLDVVRYDARTLADAFGPAFRLIGEEHETHLTPAGKTQSFLFIALAF